jgi:hypothetical protein
MRLVAYLDYVILWNRTGSSSKPEGWGTPLPSGAVEPEAPLPSRVPQFAFTRIPGQNLSPKGSTFFIRDPLHHSTDGTTTR